MASRTQWITSGDRSHPNLQQLDSLVLNYPNWMVDMAKAEEAHTSMPLDFREKLFIIQEKQRMYDGDRSHPRLCLLDELTLNYPGWERDFAKAEDYHVSLPDLFTGKIAGMKEKQKMYEGDRSHVNLVELDALRLTYPGWQEDVRWAEDAHTSKPFMFREKIMEIREKQKMYEGDRSHSHLVALDSLVLSYDGWQRDFKKAEEYHVKFPELFEGKLSGMREKQRMYNGDRTHPNLIKLDSLQLSYPGWSADVAKAEEAHTHMPMEFRGRLFEIQEKQRMYEGDRSNPRLVVLDELTLNYPGWERDVAKAEQFHVRFPELFEGKLAGIKEKQRIYAGNDNTNRPPNHTASDNSVAWASTARQNSTLPSHTLDVPTLHNFPHTKNLDQKKSSQPASASSNDDPKDGSQIGECIVCLQNPKTHAFVPCGHLCVCQGCVHPTMLKRKCPICRQRATQAIKVFFA